MSKLQCIVVTPEASLLDVGADFVTVPLYDGELGVAHNRRPMLGRLGNGEMRVTRGGRVERYYVEGGFVEVKDNIVSLLTQRAVSFTPIPEDLRPGDRFLFEGELHVPFREPEILLTRPDGNTDILENLTDDPRHFEWRFTLAHSWLYEQAEPLFTNILYRDRSASEREPLVALSTRAVAVLRVLLQELTAEYERLDQMNAREFERLEVQGYVERLDQLSLTHLPVVPEGHPALDQHRPALL